MKTTQKRTSLALLSAGLLALTMPVASHADVMASSVVVLSNFVIKGSDGVVLDYVTDFAGVTYTSSADQSVALTGYVTLDDDSTDAPIDFAPICVGGACPTITNNDFPKLAPPPATGNYSAADQLEAGAPITNVPGDFEGAATVASASYVGLDMGSVDGSANSNNNLNSSFAFTLTQDTGITFEFNVDAFLLAHVTGDEVFDGFATASYQMEFSIINLNTGATVWTFAPDLFEDGVKTVSLNAPTLFGIDFTIAKDTGGPIAFSSTTSELLANDPTTGSPVAYQLSARIQTNADATRVQVPEPGILALLGMGLLGLGLSRRRKTV